MNKKNQMKKMYAFSQMMEVLRNQGMLDYEIYDSVEAIGEVRNVKNIQEYAFLRSVSQRKFKNTKNSKQFWLEGYAIGISPISSTGNFHLIEFSLENGKFLSFPFALAKGLDENYQKFLSVIKVNAFGKMVPVEVLVKKLGLLVSAQYVDDEMSYYLHDICTVDELFQYRMKMEFSNKSYLEVKSNESK